jgi:hypothetical protein
VSLQIFVEGGGDNQFTRGRCRQAFGKLFEKIAPKGCLPRVIACGGRDRAFKDFLHEFSSPSRDGDVALLVDSEGPVGDLRAWVHLEWAALGATDEHAYLMVQCVEAWFFSDKDKLREFYGDGFQESALSGRREIEQIPKTDVENGLERATRNTQKGAYHKTRDCFDVLPMINPELIRAASPHFARLFDKLKSLG